MDSFYKKIYLHAWQILKHNWYLLFFGIFVVTLGLTGNFKSLFAFDNEDVVLANMFNWFRTFKTLLTANLSLTDVPVIFQIIGVFFFFAILLVLAISSQGALIHATTQNYKEIKKKNNKENRLVSDLRIGVDNFWPLLGLNILNKLLGVVFAAGVVTPIIYLIFFAHNPGAANFLVMTVLWFSFIPLVIIISFVTRYGFSYIIIKKQTLTQAFFSAWRLFHVYWLISLENALLLSLLTGLYAVVIISLLAFVTTPFLVLSYIVLQISPVGFWILIFVGTLVDIIIFLLATALYGAYYTVVWTEVFLKLTGNGKAYSKTERLARKHLPRLAR